MLTLVLEASVHHQLFCWSGACESSAENKAPPLHCWEQEVGARVLAKALYSPLTWMSPTRPPLFKVLPSSSHDQALNTWTYWGHSRWNCYQQPLPSSSIHYLVWADTSLVHGDSPSLNRFRVLQGVKLTRPTVWPRRRRPEDRGVYMYRTVHAGHSEPLSMWMLLWCLFYFFTEKNMVYLFKCLKMFLIRSLFSKHILLVTAKGEQYFGLIFFS